MAYRGGGGGREGRGSDRGHRRPPYGHGGGGGGRLFIWPPPPSTPRPVTTTPMGYRVYGVPMAVYRPSVQAAVFRAPAPEAPQVSFSPAPRPAAVTIRVASPSSTTSRAASSSTPAHRHQPTPQSASTSASEPAPAASAPLPAAMANLVEKKLFVSETVLAPPAAVVAAQGTSAAGAEHAPDVDLAPACKGLANHARPGLATVGKKYHFKKTTCSSHSRNGKDDANPNHDSRLPLIQPRSPLSRQSLTFDATPTYHAGAFYEIDHNKLPPKFPIHLKSIRLVKVSECPNLDVTLKFPSLFQVLCVLLPPWPELDERFVMSSNHRRVAEEDLEGEVEPDQDIFWLIKPRLYDSAAPQQVSSRTSRLPPSPAPPAATQWPAADSCLLITLKCDSAGWGMRRRVRYIGRHRDEAHKEPSVQAVSDSDPYWVKPADTVYRSDKLEEQIAYLSFKDQPILALKMDTERQMELAQAVPRRALLASADQRIPWTDDTVIQGGHDRPARKSSFRFCKRQGTFLWPSVASRMTISGPFVQARRSLATFTEDSDLKPIHDAIGNVQNTIVWRLNGPPPSIQDTYDECVGHLRLYHAIHGQVLDVSSILGAERVIYTTAIDGTLYVKVTYTEDGKDYWMKLITGARDMWNYAFQNRFGIFEYSDSSDFPYVKTSTPLDFISSYTIDGLSPKGHGNTLMGLEPLQSACKLISEYDGTIPAPLQLRMACAIFVNYLCEAPRFHDAYYFNRESLVDGIMTTLNECNLGLLPLIRRWNRMSSPQVRFFLRVLQRQQQGRILRLSRIPGIENLEPLANAIALVPFNTVPRLDTSNRRTWTSVAEDRNTLGHPHLLSREFTMRWPFNRAIEELRSQKRRVDISVAGPLAKRVDLASESIGNYMKIINATASGHDRFGLHKPSQHTLKILSWLKCLPK